YVGLIWVRRRVARANQRASGGRPRERPGALARRPAARTRRLHRALWQLSRAALALEACTRGLAARGAADADQTSGAAERRRAARYPALLARSEPGALAGTKGSRSQGVERRSAQPSASHTARVTSTVRALPPRSGVW